MTHRFALLAALAAALPFSVASAQWSVNPAANLAVADQSNEQVQPKIRATPDQGCWISWFDNASGGYDVRVQKLSAEGVEQLTHNGVLVADRSFSSTVDYDLAVDADGNALVAFNDDRGGGNNITVSKVSPTGQLLWGSTGVRVTINPASANNPHVTVLTNGEVVVGWTGSGNFFLQKLNSAGVPQWGALGVNVAESGRLLTLSDLKPGASGSVIALWVRTLTTNFLSAKGLSVQRFSNAGIPIWNAGAPVQIYTPTTTGTVRSIQNGYFPTMLADTRGGAVIGWYDNGTTRNAWVQHVSADGSLRFPAEGFAASTGSTLRLSAALAYNGSDYFMGYKTSNAAQSQWGYRLQRIDAEGSRRWGGDGVEILPLSGRQTSFDRTLARECTAQVFLFEDCCGNGGRVLAWQTDSTGALNWPVSPVEVNSASTPKARLDVAQTSTGVAVLAWTDGPSGSGDVLAQNVNPAGTLGFVAPLPSADFDASGVVDPDDLSSYITCYFTTPPCSAADFDLSGTVDPDDLSTFITAYFRATGPGGGC